MTAETDMINASAGGPSLRRYVIRFYIPKAGLKCIAAVLLSVCLSQVAVAADPQIRMLRQATAPIVAVRFTPAGGVLAASKDGTVTMWNRDSDHPLWNISFKQPPRKDDYTRI